MEMDKVNEQIVSDYGMLAKCHAPAKSFCKNS